MHTSRRDWDALHNPQPGLPAEQIHAFKKCAVKLWKANVEGQDALVVSEVTSAYWAQLMSACSSVGLDPNNVDMTSFIQLVYSTFEDPAWQRFVATATSPIDLLYKLKTGLGAMLYRGPGTKEAVLNLAYRADVGVPREAERLFKLWVDLIDDDAKIDAAVHEAGHKAELNRKLYLMVTARHSIADRVVTDLIALLQDQGRPILHGQHPAEYSSLKDLAEILDKHARTAYAVEAYAQPPHPGIASRPPLTLAPTIARDARRERKDRGDGRRDQHQLRRTAKGPHSIAKNRPPTASGQPPSQDRPHPAPRSAKRPRPGVGPNDPFERLPRHKRGALWCTGHEAQQTERPSEGEKLVLDFYRGCYKCKCYNLNKTIMHPDGSCPF